jgi:hypothetical protein
VESDPKLEFYDPLRVSAIDLGETLSPEWRKRLGVGLILDAVMAKPEAVAKLSQRLLEEEARRQELAKAGETHLVGRGLVMPSNVVNRLAAAMLKACSVYNLNPPRSLVELITVRLGADTRSSTQSKQPDGKQEAIQMLAKDPDAGTREIARSLKVSPDTVSKWKKDPLFMLQVNAVHYFETGNHLPFDESTMQFLEANVIPALSKISKE